MTKGRRQAGQAARSVLGDLFPFLLLGAVLVAWALWYQNPSRGWALIIPLAFLLPGIAARALRRTPLDLPLALFVLTALVGVWAAYDHDGARAVFAAPSGWQKLWGLLLATLAFYALSALRTPAQVVWATALWTAFGAAVAGWFIATNDWAAQPAQWAPITRLGLEIQARLPLLAGHRLNANVTGGLLAPLLPLSLGLMVWGVRQRAYRWLAWGALTGLIMAAGLFLTTSRGGWLAVAGALALGAAWWLAGRLASGRRRLWLWAALVILGLVAAGALALASPLGKRLLAGHDATNRFAIYEQGLLLVRDYPFTGSGLGNFALVHSTYALMIHVPILAHAHNLLLNIAIEQGVFGAVATAVALLGMAWWGLRALAEDSDPQSSASPLLLGGLMSLAALLIHGLVDDPLYSSRGALLLWVPAGLILAAWPETGPASVSRWPRLALAAALAIMLAWSRRPLAAAWYANLGAVAQTRAELGIYDHHCFDNPTIYGVRQQADLSAAQGYFAQALALDPGQVTARTRRSQIAFGQNDYAQALADAQAAWNAGHRDRVTRLVLGDALASSGEPAAAAEVVRGLEWAPGRFGGQAWYKYWLSGEYQLAADTWEAELILDPTNARVAANLAEARKRAAQHD